MVTQFSQIQTNNKILSNLIDEAPVLGILLFLGALLTGWCFVVHPPSEGGDKCPPCQEELRPRGDKCPPCQQELHPWQWQFCFTGAEIGSLFFISKPDDYNDIGRETAAANKYITARPDLWLLPCKCRWCIVFSPRKFISRLDDNKLGRRTWRDIKIWNADEAEDIRDGAMFIIEMQQSWRGYLTLWGNTVIALGSCRGLLRE